MEYTVLVISDALEDFERMRSWFSGLNCRVKGIRSVVGAPAVIVQEQYAVIAVCIRENYSALFRLYEAIRTSKTNAATPLIILADYGIQATLSHNIRFSDTRIVGLSVTGEHITKIIKDILGIVDKKPEKAKESKEDADDENTEFASEKASDIY